ncbi:MAG: phosphotransferase [Actinomycetia bacterium]|nr:phosphotransferase [Actinomycetes bacterium]
MCQPVGVSSDEERLDGGWQTEVTRRGGIVLRKPGPQSSTVIALLAHLSAEGFDAAPRPVGSGFDADGREQLSFIGGASPHPLAWSNEALWLIGKQLAGLHQATKTFKPQHPQWRPWFARSLPGSMPVIGHGDLGPWNIIARDGLPVAFIDWDNAGPVDAAWELAQVVWLNAQLHDDDVAALNELPGPTDRARQAALILDGYGLSREDREGFVDKMIEFAVRSTRDEAVLSHVGPDTSSPSPNGFPLLWAVVWRARAAAWMLDHRSLLQSMLARADAPPSPQPHTPREGRS